MVKCATETTCRVARHHCARRSGATRHDRIRHHLTHSADPNSRCVRRILPERFGDPIKIHTRFSRWAKSGVWERVFQHLAADADNEYAMIDSTIVRAHQHSAGAQKNMTQTRRSAARAAD